MFRFVFILKQIKCRTASFLKKKKKISSFLLGSLQVWSRQFDFSRQVSGQISILNDDRKEACNYFCGADSTMLKSDSPP